MAKKPWRQKYFQQGAQMELTEHLDELRDRVLWCLLALVLGFFLVGVPFNALALRVLEAPFAQFSTFREPVEVIFEMAADGRLAVADESRPYLEPYLRGDPDDLPTTYTLKSSRVTLRGPEGGTVKLGVDLRRSLFFFNPVEPFLLKIKIALLLALMLALPVILWNVWRFVNPGLNPGERRFLSRSLQASCFLFPLGVIFAYFMMGFAIHFLLQYAEDFVPAINAVAYVNMTLLLMVVMGIVFETPLLLLLLIRLEVLDVPTLAANRPYIFTGLLVVSAILTPPDPFTMLAMALPLQALFELSLVAARLLGYGGPRRTPAAQ